MVGGAGGGGAAIGAAYALRTGDLAALEAANLLDLQGLTVRQQRMRLLDLFIGPGRHPDETALRKAADEFVKGVLSADEPPDPAACVRGFVAEYLWGVAEVELTNGFNERRLTPEDVTLREREVKDWIDARTRRIDPGIVTATPDALRALARRLAETAIDIASGA